MVVKVLIENNTIDTAFVPEHGLSLYIEEKGKAYLLDAGQSGLFKDVGDKLLPDDFAHEVSLVFDTENGLVIFNSCSHGGLLTILREVQRYLPDRELYAFFGGLHMKGTKDGEEICTFSEEEIQTLAEAVCRMGLQKLYTGHCTGKLGYELMKKYLPDIVHQLRTGEVIEI